MRSMISSVLLGPSDNSNSLSASNLYDFGQEGRGVEVVDLHRVISNQPYRLYFYINTDIIPTIHNQCIWDKPHQPKNSVNQGVSQGARAH